MISFIEETSTILLRWTAKRSLEIILYLQPTSCSQAEMKHLYLQSWFKFALLFYVIRYIGLPITFNFRYFIIKDIK